METIRVMIIDEHPAVRRALKVRLDSTPDIDVIAVAAGIAEGERLAYLTRPNVILLGLKSRPNNAAATLSPAVTSLNKLGSVVLILSTYPDYVEQEMFVRAGASGYLLKDINSPQLIATIRKALSSPEANING